MNTEAKHTAENKFITITGNSISINLTNIEDSRTIDLFNQELNAYIKTKSELHETQIDINSNIIIPDISPIITGAAAIGGVSAATTRGIAAGGSLLARLISIFKTSKSPASELQADLAKDLFLLGKEIGVDSMSIKITKGASIGIGGDITGFKAEFTKSDDNTIELNVKY